MTVVWISRLRITGGFLAGLDTTFSPGLNVAIGPRGAGKTTLLELIRHALGTRHADKARSDREAKRVRSMLGDGEVVLDLEMGDFSHRLVVDAEGGGRNPDFANLALMLGQNELEAIASDAESRLRLIDLRAKIGRVSEGEMDAGDLTQQLFAMRADMADLEDRTRQRPLLLADLEALSEQEAALMGRVSEDMAARRDQLRELESDLLGIQTSTAQAVDALLAIDAVDKSKVQLLDRLSKLATVPLASEDAAAVQAAITSAIAAVGQLEASVSSAKDTLLASQAVRAERELALRGQAEPMRSELNDAERGLGELTARIRNTKAQIASLDADRNRLHGLRQKYAALHDTRQAELDAIETNSEQRYLARLAIASDVSQNLSDHIIVAIEHLADSQLFKDFIMTALQGSGLRYAAIAETISKRLIPRQLLNLIEERDVTAAAAATELPEDRVARVLDYLDTPDVLSKLSTIQLDDAANFLLVDGSTLKNVDQLSTGQKCAVTLPILLTDHTRALVLDQPEDHLDNAYLVDNIIVGLNSRSSASAQTIIATHNANIPVLGSAGKVLLLNSDGRRGYISKAGPFDNPEIVTAITSLMEGGKEAFRKRADFYRGHGISA